MRIAILDDYARSALTLSQWSALASRAEVRAFDQHLGDDDIIAALAPFEIVCTLRERTVLSRAIIEQLPNLKVIVVTDPRVTTVDRQAATDCGVIVCEGPGPADMPAAPTATAEFAWGLIIATVRQMTAQAQRLRDDLWQNELGMPLAGRTLGLVGLGKIGTRIAHYARAFDMGVIAWSQNLTDETAAKAGARRVDKFDLFRQSDVVSVHYVLSPRSRGLVGAAEIGAMKPTAYLVNTSRGPIVDEAALVAALTAKRIAGAGLDVFDREPLPKAHPLRALANVTMTPHLGFVVREQILKFQAGAALAAAACLDGQPSHVLNPEVLPRARLRRAGLES